MKISNYSKLFILLIPISLATLVMFGLKKEAGLLLFTRISQDTTLTHKSAQPDSIYRSILFSADKYFRNKNYEKCLIELDRAQKMRPNDADLKARIIKTKGLLSDQKLQSEEFTKAVASGDSYFNSKDYLNAKAAYQQAVGKNPDDLNVQAKLRKTMELLRSAKAQNILYDVAVASADKLFTDQEYEKALKEYENALTILPGEQYPKTKINEIIKIRVDQQVKDEEYGKAIFNADKFYNSKVFLSALQEYKRANSLKPSEKYPQDRIAELTTLINAQKTKDESYSKAIATADKYFLDTQYPEAIKTYQEALTIKPDQIYPKNRIKEIENILAEVQKSQEAYNQYVSLADSFYIDKQYMKARENYMMAHSVKPKENYPKEMMAKVENMMIGQETNMAKALDEQYISILHKADELLKSKSYEPARSEYLKASNIKPDEIYPKEKLSEIGKILEELAKSKELEMENIKALETKYLALINEADKDFKAKLYEQARSVYSNALNFKPESQYPKEKIDAIDKLLADAKRQEADYISAVDSGDHLMVSKSYSLAKIQYGNALKIKPGEAYPRNKIQEADIALGDEQKQKTLDTQYAGLIVNGDKLFMEKSFAMAKTEFVKALNLKPTQSYPKEKIAEIEKIQGELDNLQAINKQYQTILLKADQLLASKSYDLAKTEYANAGNLKPEEQYPKTKMAEIEKILADITAQKSLDDQYKLRIEQADQFFVTKTFDQAKNSYQAALTLKPEEKYPKTKIAQIDTVYAQIARQKAFDDNYAQMLANADKLFLEKSYEMAKQEYKKALALKPADPIPTARLSEIDKALGLLAQVKAKEEQYSKAIAAADKLFNEKSYEMAKTGYEAASGIKPEEQYPKDKVSEINTLLTEIARQKSIQEKYLASITKADQLLASKSYDLAKTEYTNAGNLKPEEQYPKDRIDWINSILAEIKAKEDAYKTAIANGDQMLLQKKYEEARTEYQNAINLKPEVTYPKEKIEEINKALELLLGKRKLYENLISSGDNALNVKEYAKSKEAYQQALGLFPSESYPKEKIALISSRVDSLYRANKSLYDKAIADADRFFNSFEFDKAVDSYTEAINFLPMENYPREMIAKIRRTIAENAIADVLKSPVIITTGSEKQFPFLPVNMASRKNNFVYLKIKNLSNKSFNVLMRYGKDKQPNGGVVIRNLSFDGKISERLVSVKDQDLWYREDNNWISLYPQGGDIEVSFIQVSRAK